MLRCCAGLADRLRCGMRPLRNFDPTAGLFGAGAGTRTTPSPTRLVLSRPPAAGVCDCLHAASHVTSYRADVARSTAAGIWNASSGPVRFGFRTPSRRNPTAVSLAWRGGQGCGTRRLQIKLYRWRDMRTEAGFAGREVLVGSISRAVEAVETCAGPATSLERPKQRSDTPRCIFTLCVFLLSHLYLAPPPLLPSAPL